MTWNEAVPLKVNHPLDRLFPIGNPRIEHVPEQHCADRNKIDGENEFFLRESHHQGVVRVISTYIEQFEFRAAQRDGLFVIDGLIGNESVWVRKPCEVFLGKLMRHYGGSCILERLTARYV